MKILFVHPSITYSNNFFLKDLAISLQKLNCTIETEVSAFWNSWQSFDIIHFHWPEALHVSESLDASFFEKISHHLIKVRKDCKIVYTRHNIKSHYSNNLFTEKLYHLLEQSADAIVHLGKYSESSIDSNKCNKNIVIPHHIYTNIYSGKEFTKAEAKAILGIETNKTLVLCFGNTRSKEEQDLAINAFSKCKKLKTKSLIITSAYSNVTGIISRIITKTSRIFLSLNNIHLSYGPVSNTNLPIYFCAADIVFIHRKKNLNSGNLLMAFHYGKVVVGPSTGNIGEILEETGNPTFDTNDIASASNAILQGVDLLKSNKGQENYTYALKNWSSDIIATKYFNLYSNLVNQ